MSPIVAGVLFILIVGGVVAWLLGMPSTLPSPFLDMEDPGRIFPEAGPRITLQDAEGITAWAGYEWVEDSIRERCGPIERLFFTKVAGTKFKNDDGSSRVKAIRGCKPGEELLLLLNAVPAFPDSVVVVRQNGMQLGYLDSRLAGETKRRVERHGIGCRCFFQRPTLHNGRCVGAALCMVLLE